MKIFKNFCTAFVVTVAALSLTTLPAAAKTDTHSPDWQLRENGYQWSTVQRLDEHRLVAVDYVANSGEPFWLIRYICADDQEAQIVYRDTAEMHITQQCGAPDPSVLARIPALTERLGQPTL